MSWRSVAQMGVCAALLAGCSAESLPQSRFPAVEVQVGVEGISGHVEIVRDFASDYVTPRDLHIWLPPDYSSSSARYPVIYVHDGQNLFNPALSKYSQIDWGFDEAMSALLAEGKVPPAIIVGIASLEEERFENYMPQKAMTPEVREHIRSDFAMKGWDMGEVNSDDYLRFVVEELKPAIDAHYRTQPERESTSMVGASMGGLITTYALIEYPEVFGQGAGVSTHFPIGDGAVIDYIAANLPDPARTRVYYDYGTETLDADYGPYHARVDALMLDAGFEAGDNYVSEEYDGHSHTESDWRKRVGEPLKFLLKDQDAN